MQADSLPSEPSGMRGAAAVSSRCAALERQAAERRHPTFKVSNGGEKIPHIQGKEQRLRFAGATVKKYSTSKLRETPVRR